ncbi:MAG: DUF2267 domain-containing protein [Candidatus Promineifilaceae bacterium]|nr:DUF2267 domain-containing protein [Candidatus Promineifilaceae bacterium]
MAEINTLDQFYEYVQKQGKLPTQAHAERWTVGTLKTLGINLDRKTKKQLAQALPDPLSEALTGVFWLLHFRDPDLSSYEFQRTTARRSGNTDAQFARHPILAIFGGVKKMIDSDLEQQVSESLAPEVRQLWQQAGQG